MCGLKHMYDVDTSARRIRTSAWIFGSRQRHQEGISPPPFSNGAEEGLGLGRGRYCALANGRGCIALEMQSWEIQASHPITPRGYSVSFFLR